MFTECCSDRMWYFGHLLQQMTATAAAAAELFVLWSQCPFCKAFSPSKARMCCCRGNAAALVTQAIHSQTSAFRATSTTAQQHCTNRVKPANELLCVRESEGIHRRTSDSLWCALSPCFHFWIMKRWNTVFHSGTCGVFRLILICCQSEGDVEFTDLRSSFFLCDLVKDGAE